MSSEVQPYVVGEVTFPGLADKVAEALAYHADYIAGLEEKYAARQASRPPGQAVPAWLGYARAGKDEAGTWLGNNSELKYGGSVSMAACPLIASSLGVSEEQAFAERHANSKYWFEFLNVVRQHDPAMLGRWVLADADMIVGTRAKPELLACVEQGIITDAIWVHNPRVPVDPTVEYGPTDCRWVVKNEGTLAEYHENLRLLCVTIKIKLKES